MLNTKKYFAFASVFSMPEVSGNDLHKQTQEIVTKSEVYNLVFSARVKH